MQIKMFYIGPNTLRDESLVNQFLKDQGVKVTDIQMVSSPLEGGDTIDSIMVVLKD